MKSVYERMKEENADYKIASFRAKQKMTYEEKVIHAQNVAWGFYNHPEIDANCYISVGGLDSITLLLFLRSIGINVPAISVSVLEDKSIQKIHQQLGVIPLKPLKSKREVIQKFGWPVLSKDISDKIDALQNPTRKNKNFRHMIMTGYREDGTQSKRSQLPEIWRKLFGGYENSNYRKPDFRVSDKCCYYLKEKPCADYARETGRFPYSGLMASEHGRREKALMIHGCNYISKLTKRSCPFAVFSRQDILHLALDLHVPVPEIYGEIVRDPDGTLRTTKAQRTGCSMCGFGIHMEKRPHRFDRLWERNPGEWEMWMNHVDRLPDGSWYGWGHVLDYIGVEWREPWRQFETQMSLFGGVE